MLERQKKLKIDNGSGIEFEKLSSKFVPFYQSEKNADNNVKISKVHGRNGLGRLTFFVLQIMLNGKQYIIKEKKTILSYS